MFSFKPTIDGENFKDSFIAFTKGFEPRTITLNSHFFLIISSGLVHFNFKESSKFEYIC